MAGLLMEGDKAASFDTFQYTYKIKNEFVSGLDRKYTAYNKNMGKEIVFLKDMHTSYQEVEQYFSKIAKKFNKVQINEKKLSGMPVIKNTRIPISLIVACLKDEMTIKEICQEYGLTKNDIEEAMEYVIEILDVPYQEV